MEEIKIQAPKWKIFLTILGIIAFVAMGIFMLIGDSSFLDKLVGIIAIVFFGGFGGFAMFSTLAKGQGNIIISPEAIKLNFPGCPSIPINWKDIEKFGTYKISGQGFTTIRLNNYDNLINSISPEDAEKILKKFKAIKVMGHATAVVGALNLKNISELNDVLPKSSELINFAALLNYSRKKYGGEFQIAWNMRDRKAPQFAEFLADKKKEYT